MIKKAIRWIKEKILRFKDTVVDTVTNRPAGYSGAVREYKKNVEKHKKGEIVCQLYGL